MATPDAGMIVERFMAAWERGDIEELLTYFADDAIYHPMPMKPANGKSAIGEMILDWLKAMKVLSAEVHRQVSDGQTVMNERTERYLFNGQEMTTPVASVFEVKGGLITAWREYFEMPPSAGTAP